jgi:hypothetical protein
MYQEAQELVGATGKSFNEILVSGVAQAIDHERQRGGNALEAAIQGIRAYRAKMSV